MSYRLSGDDLQEAALSAGYCGDVPLADFVTKDSYAVADAFARTLGLRVEWAYVETDLFTGLFSLYVFVPTPKELHP